jgi:hypothetical protein
MNQPDPNLTLTAVINEIKPETMNKLISQIRKKMESDLQKENEDEYLSEYDFLMSNIGKLPIRVVKPPIEINLISAMFSSIQKKKVPKSTALVVRSIMDEHAKNPVKALRVMDTIYGDEKVYGNDFVNKNHRVLGLRILEADKLLVQTQNKPEKETLESEIVNNIGRRLMNINDEVLEELFIPEQIKEMRKERKSPIVGTEIFSGIENLRMKKMIDFYSARATSRLKIKNIVDSFINIDDKDYEVLSTDFKLTKQQVKELIDLLRSNFDKDGAFRRKIFEQNIPQFARFEKNVFEFLWYYLKTLDLERNDRVSFLNSLSMLIDRIKLRKKALRMLTADVFRNPTQINFSDRNAVMLSNLLLRKYNKEKRLDIELTPEEVLLVGQGIDSEITKWVNGIIDYYQEIFLIKIITLQNHIKWVLRNGKSKNENLSIRFLFSLEKEILIFFALVGGVTAKSVMRIAMKEYGNPTSEIYNQKYTSMFMPLLLQRLRLVVRGFGRVGEGKDLQLLYRVKESEMDFLQLGKGLQNILNQVIEYTTISIRKIQTGV